MKKQDNMKKKESTTVDFKVLIIYTLVHLLIYGFFLWIAWNLVMPQLFNLPSMNYFQGVVLYALLNLVVPAAPIAKRIKI